MIVGKVDLHGIKVGFAWSKGGLCRKGLGFSLRAKHGICGRKGNLFIWAHSTYPTWVGFGHILGIECGALNLSLMINFCHLKFWADHKSITSRSLS